MNILTMFVLLGSAAAGLIVTVILLVKKPSISTWVPHPYAFGALFCAMGLLISLGTVLLFGSPVYRLHEQNHALIILRAGTSDFFTKQKDDLQISEVQTDHLIQQQDDMTLEQEVVSEDVVDPALSQGTETVLQTDTERNGTDNGWQTMKVDEDHQVHEVSIDMSLARITLKKGGELKVESHLASADMQSAVSCQILDGVLHYSFLPELTSESSISEFVLSLPQGVDCLKVNLDQGQLAGSSLNLNTLSVLAKSADTDLQSISSREIYLNSYSGSISLRDAQAYNIEIQSSSGALGAVDLSGSTILLESISGSISIFGCQPDSLLQAQTDSGRIDLTLSDSLKKEGLQAETETGSIYVNGKAVQTSFSRNRNSAIQTKLSTRSGSIEISES